jgi:hypothetical protein
MVAGKSVLEWLVAAGCTCGSYMWGRKNIIDVGVASDIRWSRISAIMVTLHKIDEAKIGA